LLIKQLAVLAGSLPQTVNGASIMNPRKTFLATCMAAALVGFAPPAFAQHHGGGGGGHSRGGGGGAARGGQSRGGESRGQGGNVNRSEGADRGAANRSAVENRGTVNRSQPPAAAQRYQSNRGAAVRSVNPRAYSNVRGGYYGRYSVGSRYSRIAPTRFYRPYYSFRPRLSLGFGLWAGYPFAYSYDFYDPFYYPYGYVNPYPPYAYGYPAPPYPANPPSTAYPPSSNYPSSSSGGATYPADGQGAQNSIGVEPNQANQANTGGLSFEITPASAELFVDGNLVGTVGQFTPTSQPLGLPAGRHKVEVKASGYRTMSFDVDIMAGEVIPYQGTMER
jgi:hypothetical protein